jgi:ribosome-associated protein
MQLADDLHLDERELEVLVSRSGGPGGQNVNKVATKVTVRFVLAASAAFSPEQKERLLARLASRISKDGRISVSSQRHRTQPANKKAAFERLAELLQDALEIPVERRPTRVPRIERRRRLEGKRQRSATKQARRSPLPHEP